MQITMTEIPVVRKFSSNRFCNAFKQPCRQRSVRWSDDKGGNFHHGVYHFVWSRHVAGGLTAGIGNIGAPVCIIIYPTAPQLKHRTFRINWALVPLTRLFQSHLILNQIPIAHPFCGICLLKITKHFLLYFITNLVKGQLRVMKRHVKKGDVWVWDSPVTHLSAVYMPRSAPPASGETGAGKTARNHSHNPTISIGFCINDIFLNIFTIKYQVNTTYRSFLIH